MLDNNLPLASFVKALNSSQIFIAPKCESIHYKSNPYDISGLINAFKVK